MAQLKRYNGTSWENVGGSVVPKTSQTTSDTDTYSCNYLNNNLTNIKSAIDYKSPDYMGDVVVESIRSKNMLNYMHSVNGAIPVNSTTETLDYNTSSLTSSWIPCKPNTTYILSGSVNRSRWQTKASNGTITYITTQAPTLITPNDAKYFRVYYYYKDNGSILPTDITDIQIEEGDTATAYSPYQQLGNEDTGWIDIQFTSNDWKERGSDGYAPKYRILNNVLYLQGQFATKQTLSAGTHVINTTNLPMPKHQYSFCSVGFGGEVFTGWIIGNTISIRTFTNSYSDGIGVAIDGCYPLN